MKNIYFLLLILSIFLVSCASQSERLAKKGMSLEKRGMLEKAKIHFDKALQINPEEALAHIGLGYIYYKKGLYDKAIAEYKKGIAGNPNISILYPEAHYYLGLAYNEKDMTEEARKEFSQYRKFKKIEY
ncbi:MAG TPA: tetratricopeptide repeat protein [Nitrospinota bacterium]|nr:tetratricopeptide repeat protein [Nitrospinota bacterium]